MKQTPGGRARTHRDNKYHYQGCSPNKTRRTKLFKTPRKAAIAFPKLMKDTENDPIAHIDFWSPSVGPSVMLREPIPAPRWKVLGCI